MPPLTRPTETLARMVRALPPAVGLLLLVLFEPALANKFEAIGGGVSGSAQIKLDWLKGFLYVVGGISLLSGILAVVVPHDNPLFLNFRNWKRSAVVLFIIAGLCFAAALLI